VYDLSQYGTPVTEQELFDYTQPASNDVSSKLKKPSSKVRWNQGSEYYPSEEFKLKGLAWRSSDKPRSKFLSAYKKRKSAEQPVQQATRLLKRKVNVRLADEGSKNIPEVGISFDNERYRAWLQMPDFMRRRNRLDPNNRVTSRHAHTLDQWWDQVEASEDYSSDEARYNLWLLKHCEVQNYRKDPSSLHPSDVYEARSILLQRHRDQIDGVDDKIDHLSEISLQKKSGAVVSETTSLVPVGDVIDHSPLDQWDAVRQANFLSALHHKIDQNEIDSSARQEAFIIDTIQRCSRKARPEVSKKKQVFVPSVDIDSYIDLAVDESDSGILLLDLDSEATSVVYEQIMRSKERYVKAVS
jgi:hypothetical protein